MSSREMSIGEGAEPGGCDASVMLRKKSMVLAERILGLADRHEGSPTYGCFDRYYWCYRLHDLANARFQEAALYLALARDTTPEGYRTSLGRLISGSIKFWHSMRHSDGSVDEVYPYERSFCATAMTAQALSKAAEITGVFEQYDWLPTAIWLEKHDAPELTNQMAGACAALARIGQLTHNDRWLCAARRKFDIIRRNQLENGCFVEYGGADIGYATISLALLADYHKISNEPEVLECMRACEEFLCEQVDGNGLYDWHPTSRQTQFIYPSGLAYLKSSVLSRLLNGLDRNVVINPLWMDDRYSIPLAGDYLAAACICE